MRRGNIRVVGNGVVQAGGTVCRDLNIGNITLLFKETSDGVTMPGSFQFLVNGGGEIATTGTRLKDISRFINADGRNILDNTQELTIFGNGRQTIIYIEGNDTISDLEHKLTKAIVEDLGMGADLNIISAGGSYNLINNNLVNYVPPRGETPGSNEAVAGTFVIQTAFLGANSRLTFTGDQGLIDALSLATIQQAEDSTVKIKVSDAHTGRFIGSEVVWDYTLKSAIKGVEVEISSKVGIYERWDLFSRRLVYSSTGIDNTTYLHIVDNRTDVQVGANKGQSVNISVAQLDCRALGLTDMTLVHMDLAQKGITLLDRALERVNSARSSIGAQVNRLELTISGLMTTHVNLVASESRIRDLDYAEETAIFTRNQIIVNAAVSMLAQANTLPEIALQLIRR
jgi:flagellin